MVVDQALALNPAHQKTLMFKAMIIQFEELPDCDRPL